MSKEFKFFLKSDLSRYQGKYIAIVDNKVVACDDNAKKVWEKAKKKYPNRLSTIAKLPREEALIL
jgi:hypothetical protein